MTETCRQLGHPPVALFVLHRFRLWQMLPVQMTPVELAQALVQP
jgi:hypothetical protein